MGRGFERGLQSFTCMTMLPMTTNARYAIAIANAVGKSASGHPWGQNTCKVTRGARSGWRGARRRWPRKRTTSALEPAGRARRRDARRRVRTGTHLGGQVLARCDLAAGREELVIGAPVEDVPAKRLHGARASTWGGQAPRAHVRGKSGSESARAAARCSRWRVDTCRGWCGWRRRCLPPPMPCTAPTLP